MDAIESTMEISNSLQPDDGSEIEKHALYSQHPDFGKWAIGEIQLCEMGSHDPVTGGYVAVGRIRL